MIPQDFLKALATERRMSDAELAVLLLAIEGQSIPAIANKLRISEDAVRKRLGEVYKKFQIGGAGPGKLAKLQQKLVSLYQEHQIQDGLSSYLELGDREEVSTEPRQDWGEAPDVSVFYGRTEELATLERWIVQDQCRLVALLGMGGIGKTTLSVRLAKQIQDEFEFIVWRSLRNAPKINDLLGSLIQFLSYPQKADLPKDIGGRVSRLIEHLRRHRCLLILDDVETILRSGDFAGHYREGEGYKGYGELLRRLGGLSHQSCLVLTSQEEPREVALLEGETLPVRSLQLTGLKEVQAREILKVKGLSGEDEWGTLIKLYRGNPLALKIVSTTIQESFDGSVPEFLSQSMTWVVRDIRDLIGQQFDRLSDLEKEIMYWLVIEQEPVSLSKLLENRKNTLLPIDQSELPEALGSLIQRSLIERSKKTVASFELQLVIRQYVTNRLVEQFCQEICDMLRTEKIDKIQLLRSHALPKSQREDDAQEVQVCPILILRDRLRTIFRSESRLADQLNRILSMLQEKSQLEVGYASKNVLNLLAELTADSSHHPSQL